MTRRRFSLGPPFSTTANRTTVEKSLHKKTSKIYIQKLKDGNVQREIKEELNNMFDEISKQHSNTSEVENLWNKIKDSVVSITESKM